MTVADVRTTVVDNSVGTFLCDGVVVTTVDFDADTSVLAQILLTQRLMLLSLLAVVVGTAANVDETWI